MAKVGSSGISQINDAFRNGSVRDMSASLINAASLVMDKSADSLTQPIPSIMDVMRKITEADLCNFNDAMGMYMNRLMQININEKFTTLNALGSDAHQNGDSTALPSGLLNPSYAKERNYTEFVKKVHDRETQGEFSTRKTSYNKSPYETTTNLYPDELDRLSGVEKSNVWKAENDKNSILYKTKKLFAGRKINSLISRFGTGADALKNNLEYNGSSRTKEYGESRGRNLLKRGAEKGGGAGNYQQNGYNNPYCRVWTHHYQYDKLYKTMRPFTDGDEKAGTMEWKSLSDIHNWGGDFVEDDENGTEKKIKRYGWKSGKKTGWDLSVLDVAGKGGDGIVKITPKYLGGEDKNIHTKDCMFSIENLAWRDYDPYSFERALSWEQRGPLGGRIMWFPPYGIQFNENTNVNWSANTFIGRGEDVYTYVNTTRSGTLSFLLVVDHPSVVDYATWYRTTEKEEGDFGDTDLLRFFAGCDTMDKDDEGSILSQVKPTPLTDEYLEPEKENKKVESKVPPMTETPAPPEKEDPPKEEEMTLSFPVFFPNNYSGITEYSGAAAILTLLCAEGCSFKLNDNKIQVENTIGYEMGAEKGMSFDKDGNITTNKLDLFEYPKKINNSNFSCRWDEKLCYYHAADFFGFYDGEINDNFFCDYLKNKKIRDVKTLNWVTEQNWNVNDKTVQPGEYDLKDVDTRDQWIPPRNGIQANNFYNELLNGNTYKDINNLNLNLKNVNWKDYILQRETNKCTLAQFVYKFDKRTGDGRHIPELLENLSKTNSFKNFEEGNFKCPGEDDEVTVEIHSYSSTPQASNIKNQILAVGRGCSIYDYIKNCTTLKIKEETPTLKSIPSQNLSNTQETDVHDHDSLSQKLSRCAIVTLKWKTSTTESGVNATPNTTVTQPATNSNNEIPEACIYSPDEFEFVKTTRINNQSVEYIQGQGQNLVVRNIGDNKYTWFNKLDNDNKCYGYAQTIVDTGGGVYVYDDTLCIDSEGRLGGVISVGDEQTGNGGSGNNENQGQSGENGEGEGGNQQGSDGSQEGNNNNETDLDAIVAKCREIMEDKGLVTETISNTKIVYYCNNCDDVSEETIILGFNNETNSYCFKDVENNKCYAKGYDSLSDNEIRPDINYDIDDDGKVIIPSTRRNIRGVSGDGDTDDDETTESKDNPYYRTRVQNNDDINTEYGVKLYRTTEGRYLWLNQKPIMLKIDGKKEKIYTPYNEDSTKELGYGYGYAVVYDVRSQSKSRIKLYYNNNYSLQDPIALCGVLQDNIKIDQFNGTKFVEQGSETKYIVREYMPGKYTYYFETDAGTGYFRLYAYDGKKQGEETIRKICNFRGVPLDTTTVTDSNSVSVEQQLEGSEEGVTPGIDPNYVVNWVDIKKNGDKIIAAKQAAEEFDKDRPKSRYEIDKSVNGLRYDQEYYFFKALKAKDPITFNKLVDKLQYFDPAFHSMTPEGFNARLTFLQQCTRQGDTRTASDTSSLTASNLAFGRPPFCVLRIGDFYNQMIIIDSLNVDYSVGEDISWDLNSEGIGMQPLLAKVNISFKFIGGGDLAGPIRRLQNAMSFNYYANTRLYDNRADTVEYDWDPQLGGANGHHKIKTGGNGEPSDGNYAYSAQFYGDKRGEDHYYNFKENVPQPVGQQTKVRAQEPLPQNYNEDEETDDMYRFSSEEKSKKKKGINKKIQNKLLDIAKERLFKD